MKTLRTLALSLVLLSSALAHAGERQSLETYVSPAPSLMPILVKQADAIGLTAEQQARLAEWRKVAQPKRVEMEKAVIADRLAVNQAVLDGKSNIAVQTLVKSLQRKEMKLVVAKLACRDYVTKTLNKEQMAKLVTLYGAP